VEEASFDGLGEDDDAAEDIPIDVMENTRNRTPREHVKDEAVGREIERRFIKFLRTFKDPVTKQPKYVISIRNMASENKESFEVDYNDFGEEDESIAIVYYLPEAPLEVLERLDKAATVCPSFG